MFECLIYYPTDVYEYSYFMKYSCGLHTLQCNLDSLIFQYFVTDENLALNNVFI
jgi:hypothetical protein